MFTGPNVGLVRAGLGLALLLIGGSGCGSGSGAPPTAAPPSARQPTAAAAPAAAPAQAKPASAAAAKPPPVDLCSLVTAAEAEAIVGKLRSGPEPLKGPTGNILDCHVTTDGGGHFSLDVVDAEQWAYLKSVAEGDKETVKVSGVGEDAFLEAPNRQTGTTLRALKKPNVLSVQVAVDVAKDVEFAKALAAKALARL